jgi:hypothetical protein
MFPLSEKKRVETNQEVGRSFLFPGLPSIRFPPAAKPSPAEPPAVRIHS